MKSRKCLFRLAVAVCFAYAGCSPVGTHPLGEDKHGCTVPPPDTFTSAGIDARFAQSTFGKVVTGDVDVKINPSVVSLASNAARSAHLRDYLRCLARNRDKFSPAQTIYLDTMNAFLETKPTPEGFMQWQKENRFPTHSDEPVKVLEREVDELREQVAKDNQELRAVQEHTKARALTASQRASFVEALSKGEKGEIAVSFVSGNSESEHFAYDIALALQESGWKVANMNSTVFLGGTPVGLTALVKDPQVTSVQTLLSALLKIDRKIQLKINPKLDHPIDLHVGSKP